ncbi:hypothetical protein GpartN1_g1731.t1 [Galdieria partita]|uniref:Signal recognition particle 54 kDa protein n=1 Tax=Galdieria partita TaxID=83374 RepID=A0A9C7UNX7_9RHOD|nr:hypothetical protein GpartN1_g1731.t1 [Galdieria partita]
MVLSELGKKISGALRKLANRTVVDEEALNEMLNEVSRALLEADVNVKLVQALRQSVKRKVNLEELAAGVNRRKLIQKAVFDELCNMLNPGTSPPPLKKGKPNVVMFVGLQGNGKTTTCVKYAYYHQRKGWKTALVCADTFRAGAFDQLKQSATKARVPFYGSHTEADAVKVAREGVDLFKKEKYELIIVDTSGRHKQDTALFEEMEQLAEEVQPNSIIFVMDGTMGQSVYDQALAFRQRVNVGSVIVTKLDGHAKGGGALSAVSATKSPIVFIGTGEMLDDLEPFAPQSFVQRLLGLGDISGFVNAVKEAGVDQNPDILKRIQEGVLTLRDLYDQFQSVLKMGPMGKVLSMFPGMQDLIPKGKEREGTLRVKKFLSIMNSMTDEELDNPKVQFNQSRMIRISRGSGRDVKDVEDLLSEYKRLSKLVSRVGKNKALKTGDFSQLQRNMPQQLSRMMDPKMLQQMGGASGLQNLMKQFSSQFRG